MNNEERKLHTIFQVPRPHELQNDLIPLFPSSNKVVAWNLLQVVWEILGHSRKHKLKGGGGGRGEGGGGSQIV